MSRQLQSESIDQVVLALVKAQGKIKHAVQDAKNPHFRNDYATLEAVIDATKAALGECGLVVIQQPFTDENGHMMLITTLAHTSGQWVRSYTSILTDKPTMQNLGSALTYSRRYALAAMCNIGQTDDDGNMASGNGPQVETPKAAQAPRASVIRRAENPQCCGQNMMSDKFTKGAFYCPKCGKKQAGGVA